jgi:hypothetical protein
MATDRARRTHDAARMYRSVVLQQGRVTLEADANEAEEIRAADARAALADVIGSSGSPDDGYKITVPTNLADFDVAIGAGVLYVGGVRVETAATTYRGQQAGDWADYALRDVTVTDPDQPPVADPEPYPGAAGRELFYLELTEQEVSAVEDPALREVALGGPDTAARTRMRRRVRRAPVTASTCETAFAEVRPRLVPPAAGDRVPRPIDRPFRERLPIRFELGLPPSIPGPRPVPVAIAHPQLVPTAAAAAPPAPTPLLISSTRLLVDFLPGESTDDPCQPAAQAGFLGVENQLIRVQIAAGGKTLLWGYDNASFLYRATIDPASRRKLRFDAAPVDGFHDPRNRQWVEVLVPGVELGGDAQIASPVGRPVAVHSFDPGDLTLTLDSDVPAAFPNRLFVRVWENRHRIVAGPIELVRADNTTTGVRVTISGGAPIPGDHWMIGVRPSVPEAIYPARLRSSPQPPDGPRRWAVPLAVVAWTDAHTATVSDCRKAFRPLVEDDDLEFHNQHLHGWGVVCGLQVTCPPLDGAGNLARPHEQVNVRDGYAIHPSGADIRVRTAEHVTSLALGDLAVAEGVLDRVGGSVENGAVSLWVDEAGKFHVDRYDPAQNPTWQERFQDTLLVDVYQECVLPLGMFVKSQLTPAAGEGLVGPATRRRIAVTNLLWQIAAQNTPTAQGTRIYLSGAPGPQTETEDKLLRDLFLALKSKLEPRTFCAMFDDVAYPDYDVYAAGVPSAAPRPTTIFGTGQHTRLRIDEPRQLAFTCGRGDKVNVYDLSTHRFLDSVAFPIPGAEVQDVAFSPSGHEIYAIAWTGSAGSAFASGVIDDQNVVRWSVAPPYSIPDLRLATMVSDPNNGLFAAAIGKGIYQISATATPSHKVVQSHGATGHLVAGRIGNKTVLYAGENRQAPGATVFTSVLGFELPDGRRRYFRLPQTSDQPGVGRDDVAVVPSERGQYDELYAIIDGAGTTKRLVIWDPSDPEAFQDAGIPPAVEPLDLGHSAASRIAHSKSGKWSMITYLDSFVGKVYRRGSNSLGDEIHPLQIAPAAIATTSKGEAFHVLNLMSSTITVVPAAAGPSSTVDVVKLETYRRKALAAYMKMIGRVAQYLKDCLCQRLLIECPTGAGKVYLADVSFKDGKVYQICNFGRRKYVHSFPTVEYWMSLVPIVALLKEQVEKLCCGVITGFFDKLAPPEPVPDPKDETVPTTMARAGLGYVLSSDLQADIKTRKSQLTAAGNIVRAAFLDRLQPTIADQPRPPIIDERLSDRSVEDARKFIEDRGVTVRRTEVATLRSAVEMLSAAPTSRGDSVDLLTDASGRVLGWRRLPTSAPLAPAPADAVVLRRQLDAMTEAHAKQAATIDKMQEKLAKLEAAFARLPPR